MQLKAVEDREIEAIIKKQEAAGLKSITDGEYRRAFWNYDFLGKLDGVEAYLGERKISFQGAQPKPMMLRVIGKLGGYMAHPMIEHFKFVQAHTKATPKMTIPSPSSLHFRYGRAAVPEAIYPAMDDFYRDLGTSYRKAVRAFADAGCRYLQLDEVNFTYLCDPELREHVTERGDDPGRAAAHLRPHDQRRDLRHPGRHDHHHASVPRQLPVDLRRLGRLRAGGRDPVQQIKVTAISWNTTASAPAASSRCASCRRTRPWCWASSPPRAARWRARTSSSAASTRRRSTSALDQLCLSPQCGFASTEEGNILTEEQQWAKLRMIVELSEEVWGRPELR